MEDRRLLVCLEAKDDQDAPVYLIYSTPLLDLLAESESPPHFTIEAVISGGVQSMGCGLFGSKIVLAGGFVKDEDGEDEKYKGVITYDRNTKHLSLQDEDVLSMRGGKVKPLVFQLNNKLYVLDTSRNPHWRSFEVYYPNQKHWHRLDLDAFTYGHLVGKFAESDGLGFFSWFVFGHCLCLSLPKDMLSYVHYAKTEYKRFKPCYRTPLPFPGMAITYCQHGFDDVVLITFSKKGVIEGRRLCISYYKYQTLSEKTVPIWDTKTYSKHDGDLTGWFAEFGNGTFCLTAFDDVNIFVYMFKISRRKCTKDEDLNLKVLKKVMHRYKYTDFREEGCTCFSFGGCFVPSPTGWSKESAEAKLYGPHFRAVNQEEEDDVAPYTKCVHNSDSDDMERLEGHLSDTDTDIATDTYDDMEDPGDNISVEISWPGGPL
ncbi:uncharacterized protein LOC141721625 [Apium graveolens]|uniref:uncharacterized protein LOC141721625 n=1 Tax=Apium graveolens TaxID=4045 RepID=UPI003D78C803